MTLDVALEVRVIVGVWLDVGDWVGVVRLASGIIDAVIDDVGVIDADIVDVADSCAQAKSAQCASAAARRT